MNTVFDFFCFPLWKISRTLAVAACSVLCIHSSFAQKKEHISTHFKKTISVKGDQRMYDATPCSDGGVLATGSTQVSGNSHMEAWVIKLDKNGIETLRYSFGKNEDYKATALIELPSGKIAIGGKTANDLSDDRSKGSATAWIACHDSKGAHIWDKDMGDAMSVEDIVLDRKNNHIVTAILKKGGLSLMALDFEGNVQFEHLVTPETWADLEVKSARMLIIDDMIYIGGAAIPITPTNQQPASPKMRPFVLKINLAGQPNGQPLLFSDKNYGISSSGELTQVGPNKLVMACSIVHDETKSDLGLIQIDTDLTRSRCVPSSLEAPNDDVGVEIQPWGNDQFLCFGHTTSNHIKSTKHDFVLAPINERREFINDKNSPFFFTGTDFEDVGTRMFYSTTGQLWLCGTVVQRRNLDTHTDFWFAQIKAPNRSKNDSIVDINTPEIVQPEGQNDLDTIGKVPPTPPVPPTPNQNLVVHLLWRDGDADEYTSSQQSFAVKVVVTSNVNLLPDYFEVRVNGEIYPQDGRKFDEKSLSPPKNNRSGYQYDLTWGIDLKPGKNKVEVLAKIGTEVFQTHHPLTVNYKPYNKKTLYVISIGIPDNSGQTKFSTKDALDFAQLMQAQEDRFYGEVKVFPLIEEAETEARDIEAAINKLIVENGRNTYRDHDAVVVFLSGHGFIDVDDGAFRVQGSDYDLNAKKSTSINIDDLKKELDKLPCLKFFLVDACQSALASRGRKGGHDDDGYANVLNNILKDSKGVRAVSACSVGQYSYEDPAWENGAFTFALKKILSNKDTCIALDQNKDQGISLSELFPVLQKEVGELVKKAKHGKIQTPFFSGEVLNIPFFFY
jgi:hypothetical protein